MKGPYSNSILKLLSGTEAFSLLEIMNECPSCTNEDDIQHLISRIKTLIPYEFAVAAFLIGRGASSHLNSYKLINVTYPPEWLNLYISKNFHLVDPIVKENFSSFPVQYWSDTYNKYSCPKDFISTAGDFGLKEGYSYGIGNCQKTEGSLFSFAGNLIEKNARTEIIIRLLIPHIHISVSRLLLNGHGSKHLQTISEREKEVLNWTKQGKSTWDISMILGISENTVQFHIKNILKKLDATNRIHAVALAIAQGLIGFD